KAKQEIMDALNNNEKSYAPILDIISRKASGRLDTALHMSAYVLNPYYLYNDLEVQKDDDLNDAIVELAETLFGDDYNMQNQITLHEFPMYKGKLEKFSRAVAIKGCEVNDEKYDPALWWSMYGGSTPNLKKIAMRIRSLTTSSSGCERNWSTFEGGDEYVNKEEGNAHNTLETRTVSNNIADLEKPNVNNIVDSENNDAVSSSTDNRIKVWKLMTYNRVTLVTDQTQQGGRESVISRFRMPPTDQLTFAEGSASAVTITADPCPTRDIYTTVFLKILTMSEPANLIPTPPTSGVRNTVGKGNEQTFKNSNGPASDAALWEFCDKYYHHLLPIIAEKVHQEKVQKEKLKEVKAHLKFKGCSGRNSKIQEVSQHFESRTPNLRGEHGRGRRFGRPRSMSRIPKPTSVFSKIRRGRSKSPRHRLEEKGRKEGGVFGRLGDKRKNVSARSESRYQSSCSRRRESVPRKRHHECSRRIETLSKSEDRGHWKSRSKKPKLSIEENDLSQPWVCEETNPFMPRIRYFDLQKKTRMSSNIKTYDGSEDTKDHFKKFQTTAKVKHWAMPTWFHMFNSTLTGSAKKCIKDPVEIHHIKQREGESIEDFVQRFKNESRHVKGSPECMRISRFMHRITNPELIKLSHNNIPKSMDEMMSVTTTFLREEVEASNQARKKTLLTNQRIDQSWKVVIVIKELKQSSGKDQPKVAKNGEASRKDKAMAILMKKFPLLVRKVPPTEDKRCHCQEDCTTIEDRVDPILKGTSSGIRAWIQQYLQHEYYALWEIIEFGDSYKAPQDDVATGSTTEGTGKKKGRTVSLTTEDMQKRKNDVKARTTLLLALFDEHQLRFSKYKTAHELWAAILKIFGGNEATKKTKKNLLKQQYGNFKAEGSKTMEQTFNKLQATISHLEFIDIEIEQDDLNQKFLTSLPSEWLMHTIVWRSRSDLDTMSLDDLYNHLKVYESEVQKKSESNSQNMAFISSAKNNSGNEEVNASSIPTANTYVSPASANIGAASISQDTACAYIASQSNAYQIKFEDITQIDEDDMEEIDIKWNMALLSMRADRF
nr:reverse transcriptase domain-containing protein [Tanacetum cinerariifolium]